MINSKSQFKDLYYKKIHVFLNSIVPDYIRQDHPAQFDFLTAFISHLDRRSDNEIFAVTGVYTSDDDPLENGIAVSGGFITVKSFTASGDNYIKDYDFDIYADDIAEFPLITASEMNSGTKVLAITPLTNDWEDLPLTLATSLPTNKLLINGYDFVSVRKITEHNSEIFIELSSIANIEVDQVLAKIDIGEYARIADMLLYKDIDTTLSTYMDQFRNVYLDGFNGTLAIDPTFLIKNIRDFYRSKGSEASFEFLFRAIWGTDVTFYYPKEEILKTDDGVWLKPTLVGITTTDEVTDFLNDTIKGQTTGSFGNVDDIFVDYAAVGPGTPYADIPKYLAVFGDSVFQVGETITSVGGNVSSIILSIDADPGSYFGLDGLLDGNHVLQDDYYWQDFSYELSSSVSDPDFNALLKKLIHPSGFQLFSRTPLPESLSTGIQVDFIHYAALLHQNFIHGVYDIADIDIEVTSREITNVLMYNMNISNEAFEANIENEQIGHGIEFEELDALITDEFSSDPDGILDLNLSANVELKANFSSMRLTTNMNVVGLGLFTFSNLAGTRLDETSVAVGTEVNQARLNDVRGVKNIAATISNPSSQVVTVEAAKEYMVRVEKAAEGQTQYLGNIAFTDAISVEDIAEINYQSQYSETFNYGVLPPGDSIY